MGARTLQSEELHSMFMEELPEMLFQWRLEADSCPESMDEEDWRLARDTRAKAKLLLRWAKDLHGVGASREAVSEELDRLTREEVRIHWDRIGSKVLSFGPGGEVSEHSTTSTNAYDMLRYLLDLEICEQELSRLPLMADRAIKLLDRLVSARSIRTKIYLARVAECYLRNMSVEGVIMCRAVLEAALAERLDDDAVIRSGSSALSYRVDLADQLRYLERERLLSTEVFNAADAVRSAGNGAIHRDPSTADFDSVFTDLITALDGLEIELGGDGQPYSAHAD